MAKKKENDLKHLENNGKVSNSKMCNLFFSGGREHVQKLLVDTVKKIRCKKNISKSKLNELCFFEEDGLDKCEVFEKNASKMTQEIFCRVACVLDLKLEDVLKLDFTEDRIDKIVKEMEDNNAGLAAALSIDGEEEEPIYNKEVAPIYARIKILNEV